MSTGRIDRIAKAFDVELRITQFPLHPDTPIEGLTLEQLFGGSFDLESAQERIRRIAAEEGLPYGKRTHTYNSRRAQELAKWAERQPGGDAIHDALFRAYFVDGTNLARIESLVEIASSVGLPEREAEAVLTSRSFATEVDEDWHRASELGVTGVPTFVISGRGVVGAQPYGVLEQLVTSAGARRRQGVRP